MKLSVIVCLYNTNRKHFEDCLFSITNSTLDKKDYEILVIDDGSDSDYSDITEKYEARLIKTENRGIFRARLLGIKEALGDYVAFVDSDDTVTFNYHLPMLLEAEEKGLDVCFNDWAFNSERTKYVCLADSTVSGDFTYTGEEVLPAFFKNEGREHSYFVLWNKLFKSDVLKYSIDELSEIALSEDKYNYAEDTLISFFAFKNSTSVANVHTGYYLYRTHANQAVNVTSQDKLRLHIRCMSKTLDIMLSKISGHSRESQMTDSIKKWAELMSRTHYSHAKANKYCFLYDFIKESYHVDVLKKSTLRDQSAYSKNKVLPANLFDIESSLLSLWRREEESVICLCKADEYTKRCVRFMRKSGKPIRVMKGGDPLPLPRVKLKDRIIMNKFVYTLGLILFKKGSRVRAFLKKHI